WYGHLLSSNGVWIYLISSQWLIFKLTDSPAWLGAIGFAYLAPLLFFGPLAGAIADRFGQQRVAIISLAIGILLSTLVAIVIAFGKLSPPLMLTFTIIQGIFFAFDFPSRQALIPKLVRSSDISAAIGMNTTTYNTASFTGPIIGGAILALGNETINDIAGAALGYAVFAFANCFLLLGIIRVKITSFSDNQEQSKQVVSSIIQDLKSGLWYVIQSKHMMALMGLSLFLSFCLRSYQYLMAGFAENLFNLDEQGLGNLFAAKGIGALLVALFFTGRGRTQGLTKVCIYGGVLLALALMFFVSMKYLPLILFTAAIVGGAVVATDLGTMTLIQNIVEEKYRARVISIALAITVGVPAFGSLGIGFLAEFTGLQLAITLSAGSAICAILFIGKQILRVSSEIEATQRRTSSN
ncbi:MAG: MFS transporter, partial [Pseudomonadota bacterium]|nr:MFS transporter [Pseudomonadota bacterium]